MSTKVLAEHPDFEARRQSLSITTFRYVPRDLASMRDSEQVDAYLNQLNQQLLTAVDKSGLAFLSNAILGGTFVFRACIVNFHTSLADVEALPAIVARLGADIDHALRPMMKGSAHEESTF